MNKTKIYTVLLALPLLIAATGESLAWNKDFTGTRAQVRSACANVGGNLIEGGSTTTCLNDKNGTGVTCGNDGHCNGSGGGPAPRVRLGTLDIVGTVVGFARRAPESVPESLSSDHSGGSPAATGTDAGGGGWDAGDIGQWHSTGGYVIGEWHAN